MNNITKKPAERSRQKKPSKRFMQDARKAVLKDIKNRLEVNRSLIKVRQEMAEYHKPEESIKPIPSSMKKAVEEHHKKVETIKLDSRRRLSLSFAANEEEWTKMPYSGIEQPCTEDVAIHIHQQTGCDSSYFDILTAEGITDAYTIHNNQQGFGNWNCKTASGYAGSAGANALSPSYSHIIFGFWTYYQIPVDGEQFRMYISSGSQVDLGLLEAVSMVPGSQGQVEVWTNRYLFYKDQAHRVDSQLAFGMSPPPAPGQTGMWHEQQKQTYKHMSLFFDINDESYNRWVSIFEALELVAIRIGDVNTCNAVAVCNVNFTPLYISLENCTHTPLP